MATRPATRPTPVRRPTRAALPADPAAFVAAAERSTNDRDAAAVAAVFALDADSVMITDGAVERFDEHGLVREHQLYSYLSVRPSSHPLTRLKLGLAYPRTGPTLLREQRRAGVRPL